jgi:hypothetical protein
MLTSPLDRSLPAPAAKWDAQSSWHLMLPPGRPSGRHLDFVRTYVAQCRPDASIAILGSTPELRDLCVEESRPHVHVLERSAAFHEACSALLIYRNPHETLHQGDWLELLPKKVAAFDLVLSDLTLGSIPYDRRTEFFTGIRDALRPGGMFLDKVLTHGDELMLLDDLDQKYRTAPLNLQTLNDFANEYFFLSELVREGIVSIRHSHELLASRFASTPRLLRILDESLRLVTTNGVWFYGRPWRSIRRSYATGMRLVDARSELRPSVFAGRLRMLAFSRPHG